MKTLLKLALVALVANATWHVFQAYSAHYRFKDAVESTAQYRGNKTETDVRDRVLELASQYDVPVTRENLSVTIGEKHTIVETSYARPVDLLPGFTYPWPFSVHVDTFTVSQYANGRGEISALKSD